MLQSTTLAVTPPGLSSSLWKENFYCLDSVLTQKNDIYSNVSICLPWLEREIEAIKKKEKKAGNRNWMDEKVTHRAVSMTVSREDQEWKSNDFSRLVLGCVVLQLTDQRFFDWSIAEFMLTAVIKDQAEKNHVHPETAARRCDQTFLVFYWACDIRHTNTGENFCMKKLLSRLCGHVVRENTEWFFSADYVEAKKK